MSLQDRKILLGVTGGIAAYKSAVLLRLLQRDGADIRVVMQNMGTALMGTGEAEGENRALSAAEAAISNPLLDEVSMRGAKGLLISVTGSFDMTLYEIEEATSRIRREIDPDANPDINIIFGATFDHSIEGRIRVSVVATGINAGQQPHVMQEKPGTPRAIANDAPAKPPRLMDRIANPARDEQEQPPRRSGTAQESWQSSGNVTIEPRSPRYMVNNPAGRSATPPPQSGGFEPQPPAKPIRPPRRPLTGQDFPELAQHEAAIHNQRDLGLKRRGGLLDWVTGRSRNAANEDMDDRQAPGFDNVNDGQQPEPQQNQPNQGGKQDTSNQRNTEEPFEIPNFFKKVGD